VTIHLDADGAVDEARLHIVEFRGFERFIRGRLLWEVPVIVQRLCGICPVSHHLAAAKAMDMIVGVDELPPTAEKMRRLMHYGQVMQSHVLHFFHLAAPDLLFGFGAPGREKRNIFEVIKENPELGRRAILMRKFGQDIIEATAGKKIHGTGAIPGGINRNLPVETRDALLGQIDEMEDWAMDALEACARLHARQRGHGGGLRRLPLALHVVGPCRRRRARPLSRRSARARCQAGSSSTRCRLHALPRALVEDVRSWSYMKFPFIKALGPGTAGTASAPWPA
jgi:NAD-reducing hydrogenase large subunit